MRKSWLLLLFVLGTGILALPGAAQEKGGLPVKPFQARYGGSAVVSTLKFNLNVTGNLELTLRDLGDNRYQMDQKITGVLGSIDAQAQGRIKGNRIYPERFEQETSASFKKSKTRLDFDWKNKTLDARKEKEEKTLPLTENVLDPLSLYLLLMWDLQQGRPLQEYTLANGPRLRTYQAAMDGGEVLDTPIGKLRTVRVVGKRIKTEDDREATVWFAPELGYLPVQIVNREDGVETMRMRVEAVGK
jgi:hypothetical protein